MEIVVHRSRLNDMINVAGVYAITIVGDNKPNKTYVINYACNNG